VGGDAEGGMTGFKVRTQSARGVMSVCVLSPTQLTLMMAAKDGQLKRRLLVRWTHPCDVRQADSTRRYLLCSGYFARLARGQTAVMPPWIATGAGRCSHPAAVGSSCGPLPLSPAFFATAELFRT
jgi:hypothetical protein